MVLRVVPALALIMSVSACGGAIQELLQELDPCGTGDPTDDCNIDIGDNDDSGGTDGGLNDLPLGTFLFSGNVALQSVAGNPTVLNREATVTTDGQGQAEYSADAQLSIELEITPNGTDLDGQLNILNDEVITSDSIGLRELTVTSHETQLMTGLSGTITTGGQARQIGTDSYIYVDAELNAGSDGFVRVHGDQDSTTADIFIDLDVDGQDMSIGAMDYSIDAN